MSVKAEREHYAEPVVAVLFPWFVQVIGVVVFFLLARHWHALPYTAVLFLLGTLMGVGLVEMDLTDHLTESLSQWNNIDGEVLLAVFLPGLLFKDAFSANVHLVSLAFKQCLLMAFPMVLGGTALTALVAFYIFPYDWSFNLAMTLGSILSATDPVAVSALLEEVGAPPRIKVHISGESLLNDGSAMVFYTIFSSLFLNELDPSLGEEIDGAEGVKIFFRMALGGMCIGVAFGLALSFMLFLLNRRLNKEENVTQVVATISVAYLTFYVAEPVCHTSGVIAVVFLGFVTKTAGLDMINSLPLMETFWTLTEHILNTTLFALGGLVWGTVVAGRDYWEGRDWGYLFLLYAMLTVIRFFLFFAFYPVNSRLGLETNWRETAFQSFGGLRGAVGIALAIQLDDTLFRSGVDPMYEEYGTKLFGMVGGIAFLTLLINGTFAGPLLKALGLVEDTEMRKKIVETYSRSYEHFMLEAFVKLLTDPMYRNVDFNIVRHHVSAFANVTADDICHAVTRNKEKVAPKYYKEPHVAGVLIVLDPGGPSDVADIEDDPSADGDDKRDPASDGGEREHGSDGSREPQAAPEQTHQSGQDGTSGTHVSEELVIELRKIFVELLRSAYHKMMQRDEVDGREGFVTYLLMEGLDFIADAVARGEPINDFTTSQEISKTFTEPCSRYISKQLSSITRCYSRRKVEVINDLRSVNPEYEQTTEMVHFCVALIRAHRIAEDNFMSETYDGLGTEALMDVILEESRAQVRLAETLLWSKEEANIIISHLVCRILQNKGARRVELACKTGFLKEGEASEIMQELQKEILQIYACPDKHIATATDESTKKGN